MSIKIKTAICFWAVLLLIATGNVAAQAESTGIPITTEESDQNDPAIYADKVVWTDWRNANTTSNESFIWNADIYMYNTSLEEEVQITANVSMQIGPAIYEDRIVWTDMRNGNADIYMYDPASGEEIQLTDNRSDQWYPAIYNDRVVWEDTRNGNADIYMYNITSGEEIQITSNGAPQIDPVIYGDIIAWTDARDVNLTEEDMNLGLQDILLFNTDIYMYDLSSGEEKQVTVNESWQEGPAIYEDRIVWTDMRNSNLTSDDWMQWNVDIYMYDLTSGKETQITTDGSNQLLPAIYGDSIVWEDYRNHAEAADISPMVEELQWNSDIYMYNISSQEEKQITASEFSQEYPAIYEETVVWADMHNRYPDIYMTTLAGQGLQS